MTSPDVGSSDEGSAWKNLTVGHVGHAKKEITVEDAAQLLGKSWGGRLVKQVQMLLTGKGIVTKKRLTNAIGQLNKNDQEALQAALKSHAHQSGPLEKGLTKLRAIERKTQLTNYSDLPLRELLNPESSKVTQADRKRLQKHLETLVRRTRPYLEQHTYGGGIAPDKSRQEQKVSSPQVKSGSDRPKVPQPPVRRYRSAPGVSRSTEAPQLPEKSPRVLAEGKKIIRQRKAKQQANEAVSQATGKSQAERIKDDVTRYAADPRFEQEELNPKGVNVGDVLEGLGKHLRDNPGIVNRAIKTEEGLFTIDISGDTVPPEIALDVKEALLVMLRNDDVKTVRFAQKVPAKVGDTTVSLKLNEAERAFSNKDVRERKLSRKVGLRAQDDALSAKKQLEAIHPGRLGAIRKKRLPQTPETNPAVKQLTTALEHFSPRNVKTLGTAIKLLKNQAIEWLKAQEGSSEPVWDSFLSKNQEKLPTREQDAQLYSAMEYLVDSIKQQNPPITDKKSLLEFFNKEAAAVAPTVVVTFYDTEAKYLEIGGEASKAKQQDLDTVTALIREKLEAASKSTDNRVSKAKLQVIKEELNAQLKVMEAESKAEVEKTVQAFGHFDTTIQEWQNAIKQKLDVLFQFADNEGQVSQDKLDHALDSLFGMNGLLSTQYTDALVESLADLPKDLNLEDIKKTVAGGLASMAAAVDLQCQKAGVKELIRLRSRESTIDQDGNSIEQSTREQAVGALKMPDLRKLIDTDLAKRIEGMKRTSASVSLYFPARAQKYLDNVIGHMIKTAPEG